MTTEVALDSPAVEPVLTDMASGGNVSLRVYRVATDLIDSGGYLLYSATERSGFEGQLGTDFSLLGTTIAQLSATTISTDQALTGLSETKNVYLRAVAVDNTTTPTIRSRWSNTAIWLRLPDRTVPVPSTPSAMRPGVGVLSGVIDSLADSDDVSGGLTWHEFQRRCVSIAQGKIMERLLDRLDETTAYNLFRDPPDDLVTWYENLVAADIMPHTTLPLSEVAGRQLYYRAEAEIGRDGLFSSSRINSPGGTTKVIIENRRLR